ncbi:hypothetical protein EDC01DRAFT_679949 [Geopyxis carbonaria]|nr:hypothetical protein EDC01DRAFT_679949 [Geopyxis carbonaria]
MRPQHFLLLSAASLAAADFGGSCTSENRCGYDCCTIDQTCQDGRICVDNALVGSILSSALPAAAASSVLSKIDRSGGVADLLTKYSSLFTDVPLPTGLDGSRILDGITMTKTSSAEAEETGKSEAGESGKKDASESAEKSAVKSSATASASASKSAAESAASSVASSASASATAAQATGAASKMGTGAAAVIVGVVGLVVAAL